MTDDDSTGKVKDCFVPFLGATYIPNDLLVRYSI